MNSMYSDITSLTDSYNGSHYKLYPNGTTEVSGYFEARSNSEFQNISFFGMQYFLKEYMCELAGHLSVADLELAEKSWNRHGLPFNLEAWEILQDEFDGYLPVEIQAVPEGSWIPKGNVLAQMRNTDPRFPWLTTWLETMLVQNLWYPCTVATISKEVKIMMKQYLRDTGCENVDQVLPFMLHDFGFRGASSFETACKGGAAHLTNFLGTDTFAALDFIETYYTDWNNSKDDVSNGFSIPASNHAVITSWGGPEHEDAAFQNLLDQYLAPGKTVACVSDSYNLWRAIDSFGTKFKDQIVNSGGRLVVRPDTGNPVEITLLAIERLMKHFGYTVNSKGYRVLPSCIRLIWGDGIKPASIEQVLHALKISNIAAENITFGMGSGLLQEVNRDMGNFAFKVNEIVVDGIRRPVSKNPATGVVKASKAGRQALVMHMGEYWTVPESGLGNRQNLLRTVYKDGEILIDEYFSIIRERANESIY